MRKVSPWVMTEATTKTGKVYRSYKYNDDGTRILKDGIDPSTIPEEDRLKKYGPDKTKKTKVKAPWVMVVKYKRQSGEKYKAYKLNDDGTRVLKEGIDPKTIPEEDRLRKYGPDKTKPKKPVSESPWVSEKRTSSKTGRPYVYYPLDSEGCRIPKPGTPQHIIDEERERVDARFNRYEKEKKNKRKPGYLFKPKRKGSKRIVPDFIVEKIKRSKNLHSSFFEKYRMYRVIVSQKHLKGSGDWLLMRLSGGNASDKRIFYNLENFTWMYFHKDIHMKGKEILWPAS
jgi:hypothetical protein